MSILREHIVKPLTRSSSWRTVRKEHIQNFPYCAICRKKKGLEVHHIVPFHMDPSLELEPTNLVTFCRKHHFIYGHIENWKARNVKIAQTIRVIADLWQRRFL